MNSTNEEIMQNLAQEVQEGLYRQWRGYRNLHYNANTKGAAYEKAFANFLDDYFGNTFDVRTRTAVLDDELKTLELFSKGESELDIVVSFKQTIPQLVLDAGGMSWVAYNGVAFICEVKSRLTTSALRNDLDKISKLREVERAEDDITFIREHKYYKREQMLLLVYDQNESTTESILGILYDNLEQWDMVLSVEDNILLINPHLPYTETFESKEGEITIASPGLLWLLVLIPASIPVNPWVITANPFIKLGNM